MNKTKAFLVVAAGLVVFSLFLVLTSQPKAELPANTNDSRSASKPTNQESSDSTLPNLYIGDQDAPVTIVEYGDYKCPSCNQFHQTVMPQISEAYISTGKANILYRNLPYIAEDSRTTAHGAYCANEQNVFTAYHGAIYDHLWDNYYSHGNTNVEFDEVFTADNILDLTKLKLTDDEQFKNCVTSKKYQSAIDRDLKESEQAQAYGTPTFTVAEQKITGPQPFTVFKTLIDAQLL